MCDKCNKAMIPVQGVGIAGYGVGFAGQAQPDGMALNSAVHPILRQPAFVKIVLDLYVNPESATSLYYTSSTGAAREAMDTLIEERILELEQSGSVRVREPEALRIYVEAVGRVQLPRKKWVMP